MKPSFLNPFVSVLLLAAGIAGAIWLVLAAVPSNWRWARDALTVVAVPIGFIIGAFLRYSLVAMLNLAEPDSSKLQVIRTLSGHLIFVPNRVFYYVMTDSGLEMHIGASPEAIVFSPGPELTVITKDGDARSFDTAAPSEPRFEASGETSTPLVAALCALERKLKRVEAYDTGRLVVEFQDGSMIAAPAADDAAATWRITGPRGMSIEPKPEGGLVIA